MFFVATGDAEASVACPTDQDIPTAASPEAAYALVCDLNALRARGGLKPLRWNWRLWIGAQRMAQEMGRKRFFSHQTPDGRSLADRIEPTGYFGRNSTWILAENLAWGDGALASPLAVAIGWMNSPDHRRNIMDPDLREIAIGMIAAEIGDSNGGMVYVADFGTVEQDPPKGKSSRAKRAHLSRERAADRTAARVCRDKGLCTSAR
jgi:uncharacterized protein YkwD